MTLTPESLQAQLGSRPFRFYTQVVSTQNVASEWLENGAITGAVVVADEQIGGRGRQGRGWETPAGQAIAMSIILNPTQKYASQVTMLGAMAIVDMLEVYDADDVAIKWPNDVLLNGKKVSGVLPEAIWSGDTLKGVILGMGINVRVDFSDSPLEDIAISIETALSETVDRSAIVAKIVEQIDHWQNKMQKGELVTAWKARLVTIGQAVTIGDVHGVAEDVDKGGALMVRDSEGHLHRVVAGELITG